MPRKRREVPAFRLKKPKNRPCYYIYWSENRRTKRISTGTGDEAEAQRYLAEFIAGWNAPTTSKKITVSEIIDAYLEFKHSQYDDDYRSKQRYRALLVSLDPIRRAFGNLSPDSLSKRSSMEYIEQQKEKGLGNATIRRQLAIFTAALNHAHSEKWIESVPKFQKPKEPPPKDLWMTPEQVKAFLKECTTPHIKLFTMLALHTLSRKAAILDLKWSQVDLQNRLIDFNPPDRVQTKKKRVPVRINGVLLRALEEANEFALTEFVIEYNGKRVRDNKKAFQKTAKRASMEWVTPHVLRHTGATLLARSGISMWEIAGIMGDRLTTVEKHYAKHDPNYLKVSVDALEDIYS